MKIIVTHGTAGVGGVVIPASPDPQEVPDRLASVMLHNGRAKLPPAEDAPEPEPEPEAVAEPETETVTFRKRGRQPKA